MLVEAGPSNLDRLQELAGQLGDHDGQMAKFFALCPDLLCVANASGILVRVSPSWTRVLGWSPSELEGQKITQFVHPDDRVATRNAMGAMSEDFITGFVNRWKTKDGRVVPIDWSATRWVQGMTYASGRQVAEACYRCPQRPEMKLGGNGQV
jgi:PAS domain S-box-containing protein